MSDERKPVMCPWCGKEMERNAGQDGMGTDYIWYDCENCGARGRLSKTEAGALPSATRTPPNRPPRIECFSCKSTNIKLYQREDANELFDATCEDCGCHATMQLFDELPADIEAARKGAHE